MIAPVRPAVLLCSIALALSTASAARAGSLDGLSPIGRYAVDAKSCKAKNYFATLTASTIVLPTYSCEGVDYDQTEKTGARAVFAVRAKSCLGEESSKPSADEFSLTLDDGVLQFTWKDGSKSAKLRRCAAR